MILNLADRRAAAPFLQYQRYAVLGAGESGRAAARLLSRLGKQVALYDDFARPDDERLAGLVEAGVALCFGAEIDRIEGAEAVVASPGLAAGHRLLTAAARDELPVRGELELAWLCSGTGRVIAITGTNGKTTVTMLLEKLCQQAGLRAIACGNIGHAFSDAVLENMDNLAETVFVVEVSSFQLETVEFFQPDVAMVLNVTPDHLDRHASMEEYARLKQRVTDHQSLEQTLIINQDDAFCLAIGMQSGARVRRFSLERPVEDGAWLDGDLLLLARPGLKPQRILAMDELAMIGLHNVANALAALIAADAAGIERASIARTLAEFRAAPHRMELVATHNGVQYIDDSKATNIDAMRQALMAFEGGVHLIAGGRDKNSPFETMTELLAGRVKTVYLIGEAAEPMTRAWGAKISLNQSGTMDRALEAATAAACDGDTILLSPGCASFDQFRSYAHRGDVFKDWVREATGTPAE